MEAQIKQLVERYPNDVELGQAVRSLYWQDRKINEVTTDPNQITLDQLISESNNS